jgi:hypothetical protein
MEQGRRSAGPGPLRSVGRAVLFAFIREVSVLARGRVSARQPTYFLCWCKESRQRKHPRPNVHPGVTMRSWAGRCHSPLRRPQYPEPRSLAHTSVPSVATRSAASAPSRDEWHLRMGNSTSVRGIKNARAVSDSVLPNCSSGRPDERLALGAFFASFFAPAKKEVGCRAETRPGGREETCDQTRTGWQATAQRPSNAKRPSALPTDRNGPTAADPTACFAHDDQRDVEQPTCCR